MQKAAFECDMHSHTIYSDGNDTPYELIENAAARGIRVLALTDHDVIPPEEIQLPSGASGNFEAYAAGRGICLLRGIEISCESQIEDVHLVGIGCKWNHPGIVHMAEDVVLSKEEAYTETIRRLNERGYSMTLDEVLTAGEKKVPLSELQKKKIFDVMAQKGYAKDWIYAKLMVRDDPYFSVQRKKPSVLDMIALVHAAGGIAILAHPYLIDETIEWQGETTSRWTLIDAMIAHGLDGMEVRYTYDKTICKDTRPREQIWDEIWERIGGRVFPSGGSDYHNDAKKGAKNPRELGECGLTMEEFLSTPKLSALCSPLQITN
jgi:predicted metal-dependent phosphoesterase TrpH